MSVANGLVDAPGWADQQDFTHNRTDPFAAVTRRFPLWMAATCLVGALCQPDVQATVRHLQQAGMNGDAGAVSSSATARQASRVGSRPGDEASGVNDPALPKIDPASAALVEQVVATMAAGKTGPGVPVAAAAAAADPVPRATGRALPAAAAGTPATVATPATPVSARVTAPVSPGAASAAGAADAAGSSDQPVANRISIRSKTAVAGATPAAALPLVPPSGRLADAYVAPAQRALVRHITASWRVPDAQIERYVAKVWRTAGELELDPFLVLAVMATESSFNHRAQSAKGAQGLMQVHTRVHRDKFKPHGGPARAFDPEASIRVGSQILKQYLERHGGNARGALKSYVGAANLKSDGGYATKVLRRHAEFKQVVRTELTRLSAAGKLKADAAPRGNSLIRFVASAVNPDSAPH